jgi:DNA-directed RNA polymerase subunit M/transcription elongation factor TFIIS
MNKNCVKCNGLLVSSYDENLRSYELHCINCGYYPQNRDAEKSLLRCVDCKVQPRYYVRSGRGKETLVTRCHTCHYDHLLKRRKKEYNKENLLFQR